MSSRRLAGPNGLPSAPRSFSASASRPREDYGQHQVQRPDGTYQRRPQKIDSSPTSRARARSRPSLPHDFDYSTAVSSSPPDTPSLFDRRRIRREDYESPPTSIDENLEGKLSTSQDTGISDNQQGSQLWNAVAAVASKLTVSVGKAWATDIASDSGEETPLGQESRLFRAMKAYHLEKARDPSDLPDWLFEPHERRVLRRKYDVEEDNAQASPEALPGPRSRGLRDVFQAAAANPPSVSSRVPPSRFADEVPATSRTTNRLKELRDAKRVALASSTQRHDNDTEPVLVSSRSLNQRSLPSHANPHNRR